MSRKEEIEQTSQTYYNTTRPFASYKAGFIDGAEWADETMIDKACEWLSTNVLTYIEYCKKGTGESVTEFVDDFRKAMEEFQIK